MISAYVRGRHLSLYLGYITSRWGLIGYNSCIKETALSKYGKIDESTNYPVICLGEILAWISREKTPEHVVNAGRHVARAYIQKTNEKDFKTALQRVAYALSEEFSHAHISVHIEKEQAKFFVGNINTNPACCNFWLGFLRELAETTGLSTQISEIECQSKNGKFCCFLITW
jgi:hypothetical protein